MTETLAMKSQTRTKDRDARIDQLYEQLIEIEQRLIPTGLHVFGRSSELSEKADLLRMVASFDRPELGARALPKLIAEGLGIDGYYEMIQHGVRGETRELIDDTVKGAIQVFCQSGPQAAGKFLQSRANVEMERSRPSFEILVSVSEHLDSNSELESLMRALRGEYIQPGPGADIVQNPLVLPTGRNTHAVNP